MRTSLVPVVFLLATRLASGDDGVAISLAFPDDSWVLRHRVEETTPRGRVEVEADVEYHVLLRHPVEGARVEVRIRSARWSGPDGAGERLGPSPRALAFEIAGGG